MNTQPDDPESFQEHNRYSGIRNPDHQGGLSYRDFLDFSSKIYIYIYMGRYGLVFIAFLLLLYSLY